MFYPDIKYKEQTHRIMDPILYYQVLDKECQHYLLYYGSFCSWITSFQIGVEPDELNNIDKSQTRTYTENAKVQEEMEDPTSRN